MKRRQYLERLRPKDTREIVVVGGRELTCEEFQLGACARMAPVDALPPEYRALCHEFNVNASDVHRKMEHGASVADVRRLIEKKVRR